MSTCASTENSVQWFIAPVRVGAAPSMRLLLHACRPLRELLCALLSVQPKQRPSAGAILRSPLLRRRIEQLLADSAGGAQAGTLHLDGDLHGILPGVNQKLHTLHAFVRLNVLLPM